MGRRGKCLPNRFGCITMHRHGVPERGSCELVAAEVPSVAVSGAPKSAGAWNRFLRRGRTAVVRSAGISAVPQSLLDASGPFCRRQLGNAGGGSVRDFCGGTLLSTVTGFYLLFAGRAAARDQRVADG